MGATLPKEQRYTDARFRRVARNFKLDLADAVELVAFLHFVPPRYARWIFGWRAAGVRDAKLLMGHPQIQDLAKPLIEENIYALSVDVGLAILRAMQDGGWTPSRGAPQVVRDTIAELRAIGNRGVDIARLTGINEKTVSEWAHSRSPRGEGQRARAVAALVV
jgi:hypothetical protein